MPVLRPCACPPRPLAPIISIGTFANERYEGRNRARQYLGARRGSAQPDRHRWARRRGQERRVRPGRPAAGLPIHRYRPDVPRPHLAGAGAQDRPPGRSGAGTPGGERLDHHRVRAGRCARGRPGAGGRCRRDRPAAIVRGGHGRLTGLPRAGGARGDGGDSARAGPPGAGADGRPRHLHGGAAWRGPQGLSGRLARGTGAPSL